MGMSPVEERKMTMKKVVERERNKVYYRVLHVPVWIWVFFILPGRLTSSFYLHGPDRRHWIWLSAVALVCVWRGFAGRLPGVEPRPYITHYGLDQPNLPYRVVCYTAAWIDMLVPFVLNLTGLVVAVVTGRYVIADLYGWPHVALALAVVMATLLGWTPRARRSCRNEGAEKAWFYVALWTTVPTQFVGWGMWRLGSWLGLATHELARARLAVFVLVSAVFFALSLMGKLPRTQRYYVEKFTDAAET